MRSLLTFAALALAGTLAAQAQNRLSIYPDNDDSTATATNFRFVFATGINADFLTEVDASFIHGAGQVQTGSTVTGTIDGFAVTFQDDDASTAETFNFVVYADDGAGQPDPSNQLFDSGPLTIAPSTTVASTAAAFTVTFDFQTPFTGVPQTSSFHFGANFTTASSAGDGLSIFGAPYLDVNPMNLGRDNPRPGAPNVAWLIQQPGGSILSGTYTFGGMTGVTSNVIFRQFLIVPGAALNTGADVAAQFVPGMAPNPNFGVAGLYPDSSGRLDGTAVRIEATDLPFAPGAIWLSAGHGPPIGLPGITSGNIHLNLATLVVLPTPVTLDANGDFQAIIVPQGTPVLGTIVGILNFQGLILDLSAGRVRLSNTSGVSYL